MLYSHHLERSFLCVTRMNVYVGAYVYDENEGLLQEFEWVLRNNSTAIRIVIDYYHSVILVQEKKHFNVLMNKKGNYNLHDGYPQNPFQQNFCSLYSAWRYFLGFLLFFSDDFSINLMEGHHFIFAIYSHSFRNILNGSQSCCSVQ